MSVVGVSTVHVILYSVYPKKGYLEQFWFFSVEYWVNFIIHKDS